MSIESIALIGVLTLLTIVLGTDLFFLLVGRRAFSDVADSSLLDVMGHLHQVAGQRMIVVFVILFIGALTLNFTSHTRTEIYLLRIGLGSLLIYAALVIFGSTPLNNKIAEALNTDSISNVRLWHQTWEWLLWPRALAALFSFWSFLHYAMNPKV
ncbi:MAG: hypothetical protein AAFS04_00695 [Cyanobacteria bacterium J06631_9]